MGNFSGLTSLGGEGVLDHADLRAVAVGEDDLVPVLDKVGNGGGRRSDGVHLLGEIAAEGVAAQGDDDALAHTIVLFS